MNRPAISNAIALRQILLQTAALSNFLLSALLIPEGPANADDFQTPPDTSQSRNDPNDRSRNRTREPKSGSAIRDAFPRRRWAQIGGDDFAPIPRDLLHQIWLLNHSYYERLVYVSACPGQRDLSREFGFPIVKIGCCGPERLKSRMNELSDQEYAAAWRTDSGWSPREAGWTLWSPMYLEPNQGPQPISPVSLERHCLRVRVPDTLAPPDFDAAIDLALRNGSLQLWLDSPTGREYCRLIDADPNRGCRATPSYNPPEPARELYVFRIGHRSKDVDRLISIVESVVAKALGLTP